MQQGKLAKVWYEGKYACTKLLKSYQNIENEEFNIASSNTEDEDNNILNTRIGMIDLLERDFKHKTDESKDEDLYIDCILFLDQ